MQSIRHPNSILKHKGLLSPHRRRGFALAVVSLGLVIFSIVHLRIWELRALVMFTLMQAMANLTPLELSLLPKTSLGPSAHIASAFVLTPYGGAVSAFCSSIIDSTARPFREVALDASKAVLSIFLAGLFKQWISQTGGHQPWSDLGTLIIFLAVYTFVPAFCVAARFRVPLVPAWAKEVVTLAPKLPVILVVAFLLGAVFLANVSNGWAWIPVLFIVTVLAAYASILSKRLEQVFSSTVSTLVPIISRTDDTKSDELHALRVACYAAAMAQKLLLPESYVRSVYYGGLLHDIGFVGVSEGLTNKPRSLKSEEFQEAVEHTRIGHAIVARMDALKDAASFVLHHHERFDGKGYPAGLSSKQIPLGARIIAIADSYVSLTADRSYRRSVSAEEALRLIRESAGSQLDPDLVGLVEEAAREEEELGFAFLVDNYCFGFGGHPQRWKDKPSGQYLGEMVGSPGDSSGHQAVPAQACREWPNR